MSAFATRTADAAAARLVAGVVSFALGAPLNAIFEETRGSTAVAYARQVAMYLCHVAFEFSLSRVALAFERDRSTVSHACHAIEDRREDRRFDDWLTSLELMLREAPLASPREAQPDASP